MPGIPILTYDEGLEHTAGEHRGLLSMQTVCSGHIRVREKVSHDSQIRGVTPRFCGQHALLIFVQSHTAPEAMVKSIKATTVAIG